MARPVLQRAGFEGELLDTMLGVCWVECYHPQSDRHYSDAVGDLGITSEKWGPSIGLAQIRSLRDPEAWPFPDSLRIAEECLDPDYNAYAAFELHKRYGLTIWSAYKNGSYTGHVGEDFELFTGHPDADKWNQ